MNVAFDDWIPVVTTAGERRLASLCQVLAEGERFADLAVRPHGRVAVMRLLLCVAHAALDGPKDYDDWREVPTRLPEAAPKYLELWQDSFELFHPEKPWLQVAGLDVIPSDRLHKAGSDESHWTSIRRLSFTRASGSNTTLYDHGAVGGLRQASSSELALDLLVFQNYFVAGGQASARMWGNLKLKKPSNPKGGPCSGKSIVYAFLRRSHLSDTIHANLNSHEALKLHFGETPDWLGCPLWELPIESPDSREAIFNATQTFLGRLVPQTRILRLNENRKRVLLGGGFTYPKFQDDENFYPDTNATVVVKNDNERDLLCARADEAIWRELSAIVVRSRSSSPNRGPVCLANVPEKKAYDIVVGAMITNPGKPAEIVDLVDSVFHIPAQLTTPEGIALYQAEVRTAETIASRLAGAVEKYREFIDGGWDGRLKNAGAKKRELKAKPNATAATHYWTAVEKNLPLLFSCVDALGTDAIESTGDAWRKMLFACACDAYRTACGKETPRQIRAFAEGSKQLGQTER